MTSQKLQNATNAALAFVDGGRLRESGSRRPAHRGGVELVVGQTTLRQGVKYGVLISPSGIRC
jgi:hypothetical protein